MFTKAGFPCQDNRGCPQKALPHGDPGFCPCWHSAEGTNVFVEENPQTGETRIVQGCFFQILPGILVHVVRASNRPAAELSAMRQEVVQSAAAAAAKQMAGFLQAFSDSPQEAPALEQKADNGDYHSPH